MIRKCRLQYGGHGVGLRAVALFSAVTGSDNGLSPIRRQVITRTNDDILSIGHLGTYLYEILWFSTKKNEFENVF